jgi:hypothetical protein
LISSPNHDLFEDKVSSLLSISSSMFCSMD